ncbi:MAG: LysM peptidoglycan-binding domain-containing protein [Gemmatimonadales bacterium]
MPRLTISRSELMTALVGLAVAFPAAAMAQTPVTPSADTHTVKPGDTLWGIARQYLGDPFLWPEVYRLNTNVVEDPHWIYPGEVLQLHGAAGVSAVPAAPAESAAAVAAAPVAAAAEVAAAPAEAPAAAAAAEPAESASAAMPDSEAVDTMQIAYESDTSGAGSGLFPKAGVEISSPPLLNEVEQNYVPLRRDEFYSSGFLTEGEEMPFGVMLGPITPKDIDVSSNRQMASFIHMMVAVTPPKGASYQVGDTLVIDYLARQVPGYGRIVVPTGMVVVRDVSKPQNVAEITQQFWPIYRGMSVLPADHFSQVGHVRAVPISDGVEATVIAQRSNARLTELQGYMFIDKGKTAGVARGDIFEIQRLPRQMPTGPNVTPEVIARIQIVRVRDKTATGKVVWLGTGIIRVGSSARQIAKLPS